MASHGARLCHRCRSIFDYSTYTPDKLTDFLEEEVDDDSEEEVEVDENGYEGYSKAKEREIVGCLISKQDEFVRLVNLNDIHQGSKENCLICSVLNRRLNEFSEPLNRPQGFFHLRVLDSGLKFEIAFEYRLNEMARFTAIPRKEKVPRHCFSHNLHTGGDKTWWQIEEWLKNCFKSHQLCNLYNDLDWFPNRVIDLFPENGSDLRLLITENISPSQLSGSRYVTLSHCWGKLQFPRLTRETLAMFEEKMPPEQLPKTFQDAIVVTRKLGIRYIWIDSLCIIQDDVDDWRALASQMDEIYERAYLNIAATGAQDGRDGLFFERDTVEVDTIEVDVRWENFEPKPYILSLSRSYVDEAHFSNQPLVSRGWVLQERLLPSRVVHFGNIQVFWSCKELSVCESHPSDVKEHNDCGPELTRMNFFKWREIEWSGSNPEAKGSERPSQFWHDIVERYTSCNLTNSEDKLVAIAGLASRMQDSAVDHLGGYRAGLWEKVLLQDMMWYVREFKGRPSTYRAPSWSWASLDGPISYNDSQSPEESQFFVDVEDYSVTYLGPEKFGEIESASLRVRIPVMEKAPASFLKTGFIGVDGVSPGYDSDLRKMLATKKAIMVLVNRRSVRSRDGDLELYVEHRGFVLQQVDSPEEQSTSQNDEVSDTPPVYRRVGRFFVRIGEDRDPEKDEQVEDLYDVNAFYSKKLLVLI